MTDVANVLAARVLDQIAPRAVIARAVGRDDETVKMIEEKYNGLIEQYRPLQKRKLLDDLDTTRRAYLMRLLDPDVVSNCSGAQSAVIYGILHDKHALQAGMPTSISLSASVDASMPDVLSRLQRALEARGHTTSSEDTVVDVTPK